MTTSIAIHPDFQKIPGIALSFNPLLLTLMNGAMHWVAARKWAKYKAIVTEHKVTGLDGHCASVWLIKPAHVQTPAPALVYCHGGWFIMKHTPQHIENAVRYAQEAGCCVAFVDYRLAHKHAFPAGFNDCYSALAWLQQNAEKLGIDAQRIAVGGDSAGGAIAAGLAQKARDEGISLRGQLLIYPVADADCKTGSSKAFVDVPPFRRETPHARWEMYLGHPAATGLPPYASPMHGKLTGLPDAYVETGEYDLLRDEGAAYAKALTENRVNVTLNETKGTVHGYDLLVPKSKISRDAMMSRVQFLQKIFTC